MADSVQINWRPSPFLVATAGLHGIALATTLAFPPSWSLTLAALAGNYAVLSTAGLFPRCTWFGPNIARLPASRATSGVVTLSFDDGPDPAVTPKVLDLLQQAGARATFFCVGTRAEAYPDLIAEIRRRGHGVENHTYTHPNGFAFRGPRGLRQEILRGQMAIESAGGGRPTFFRAPAGILNPWVPFVLACEGLSLVSWTRRGFDTVTRDGSRVAARLGRGLRGGDILLLHDARSARDSHGQPVVLDALTRLLDEMNRKSLRSEALHTAVRNEELRTKN
jgi:peptidoglycan/xylan/chitin deacetylase (PgdA/CDA1 family)